MQPADWRASRLEADRDLDAVMVLLGRCFVRPWTREMVERELEASGPARLYVLRTGDGCLTGFCSAWIVADELHINNLAIDPTKRRQGAGTSLVRYALDQAARAGITRATLEVRESNLSARALYGRLGFEERGRRPRYYRDPIEDALILWRDGGAGI